MCPHFLPLTCTQSRTPTHVAQPQMNMIFLSHTENIPTVSMATFSTLHVLYTYTVGEAKVRRPSSPVLHRVQGSRSANTQGHCLGLNLDWYHQGSLAVGPLCRAFWSHTTGEEGEMLLQSRESRRRPCSVSPNTWPSGWCQRSSIGTWSRF